MHPLGRARRDEGDIWPGFVDALSSLLIIVLFVVMVFMVAQFFLTNQISGQERAIERLNAAIAELAEALSLKEEEAEALAAERDRLRSRLEATMSQLAVLESQMAQIQSERTQLESQVAQLQSEKAELESEKTQLEADKAQLQSRVAAIEEEREALRSQVAGVQEQREQLERAVAGLQAQKEALEGELAGLRAQKEALEGEVTGLKESLGEQKEISEEALAQVTLLNQQIAALRSQLAALQRALEAAEERIEQQKLRIEDLGERLNIALAAQVEELKRYRSEFFGRLRQVLGERSDIRIVGDRFIFQSELLFPTAEDELNPSGREQLAQLADELKGIAEEIPDDIDWILQVEGHTDERPIQTDEFPSNWELSTARAIAVVKFLIEQGIPPDRLSANGYGEHHPIAEGDSPEAYAKNRRIELKFTQR